MDERLSDIRTPTIKHHPNPCKTLNVAEHGNLIESQVSRDMTDHIDLAELSEYLGSDLSPDDCMGLSVFSGHSKRRRSASSILGMLTVEKPLLVNAAKPTNLRSMG